MLRYLTIEKILALLFFCSLLVIVKQPQNVHWDYAVHLHLSLNYVEFLKYGTYSDFFTKYFYYPPFIYWFHSLLTQISGYTRLNIVVINFTFISLALSSLRLLVQRQKFTTQQVFLFLSLSLLNFVLSFKISPPWEMMLDLPQVCLIVSISVLIYTNLLDENNKRNSIWNSSILGVLNAILLLTKWIGPVFVVIPNIFLLIQLVRKRLFFQIAVFIFPSLFFFYLWYFPNIKQFLQEAIFYSFSMGIYEQDPRSFQSLISYVSDYFRIYSIFLLLIGVFFLMNFFLQSKKITQVYFLLRKSALLFLFQFVFPVFLLTFVISNQDPRYMLPIFFGINLLIAFYVSRMANEIKANIFSIIIMILVFFQFLYIIPKYPNVRPLTDTVIQFALSQKIDTIYYFFENDSVYFNYANTELAHKENNLRFPDEYLIYKQLNTTEMDLTQRKGCPFSESDVNKKTLLVVFENEYLLGDRVSFETECSSLLEKIEKVDERISDEGKISFYKIKNS